MWIGDEFPWNGENLLFARRDGNPLTKQRVTTPEEREADPLAELSDQQRQFVMLLVEGKSFKEAGKMVGYGDVYIDRKNPVRTVPTVRAAYFSLIREHDKERAENLTFSKRKIMEDLEFTKIRVKEAMEVDAVKAASSLNAFNRACELQGREIGMFAQKHIHEHEHSVVPDDLLLKKLAKDDPELARSMADHLGIVIEGEFEEVDDSDTV